MYIKLFQNNKSDWTTAVTRLYYHLNKKRIKSEVSPNYLRVRTQILAEGIKSFMKAV